MDKATGIKVFHALLNKIGIMDHKADILDGFGVKSTKDLTEVELATACARLRDMEEAKDAPTREQRQWRSNVLTMLNKLGIYITNNDWSGVNKFLLDKRVAGKFLYEMDIMELKALHRKLHAMVVKKEEKDGERERLEKCN